MEKPENPWKEVSKKVVYDNSWIRVEDHRVINPAGENGIYGKVHFKNTALGIIPVDDEGNTWIVGQYRYPLDQYSWEIPEGGGPINEDMLESAQRELREETGLMADKWTEVQRLHLSNSVSDEEGIIFLAEELTMGTPDPEPSESDLQVKKLPFADALKMILKGEITDSLSVAGILAVARIKGW